MTADGAANSSRTLHTTPDGLQKPEWGEDAERKEQLPYKYYDIIDFSPLHILLHVTKFLEPWDIVRSQRVSKRWRSVLSSDAVIAQALLQTKEFLALDSQDIEAAIPIFRWRRNLESARPFEKIFVPWLKSTVARQVQFIVSVDGCVTVKDLFESNDRARLFRFPGTPEIIVEDYTVVMFCRQSDIVSPVVVWDTVQDNVRKIRNFRNMWLVHMDAVKNVLTVFTLCGDSFPIELEQTKWSLNGQKLDAKIVQLTTPGRQPLLWADLRGKRKEFAQRVQQLRFEKRFDIIGSLPLQVLLLVAENLEPRDIFRCPRVSKRWRSILSSDAVIKQALRSTLAFLELETKDVRSFASVLRWQRNLEFVRPFKKILVPCLATASRRWNLRNEE
ncbi:hypothetical protein VTN49DRAFT_5324 [Thermomyces lanuginosus]|uniref:uncharacterized protein n=1 Tax=Thermomyces lanuginosus TaxID=5541 RepID=UPI003744529C